MTPSQHPEASGAGTTRAPFSISVEQVGDASVVKLFGACTMDVADAVGERLVELASRPQPMLVVDISGLTFIESTGLGGIVSGHLRARRQSGELRLVAPASPIRQLLELTRLTNLFQVYERIEDAMAGK